MKGKRKEVIMVCLQYNGEISGLRVLSSEVTKGNMLTEWKLKWVRNSKFCSLNTQAFLKIAFAFNNPHVTNTQERDLLINRDYCIVQALTMMV